MDRVTTNALRPGPTRAAADELRAQRGSRGLLAAIGSPMSYSPNLAAAGVGNALLAAQYLTGEKDLGEGLSSLSDMTAMAVGSRVPAPLRKIFAGTNALTADKAKLARAEELERAGASNRDVWSQTGWWRGPEGKWRFEIDDSATKVGGVDSVKWMQEKGVGQLPLSEYASHPEFFAAYPEFARSVTVFDRKMPPAHLGSYGRGAITLRRGLSAEKAKSPFLHELQHSVQEREGFAQGGSPANLQSQAMDEYRRLAGEAEARAVQTRRNLTPQQRATAFPLDSYDTPLDRLITK